MEVAAQDLDRQRVLQFALDGPFEGPGAVIGIVANLGQVGARFRADDQPVAALRQQCRNMPQLDFHDLHQVFAAERMEDDDLVDAVQELRSEMRLQDLRDRVARYDGRPSRPAIAHCQGWKS